MSLSELVSNRDIASALAAKRAETAAPEAEAPETEEDIQSTEGVDPEPAEAEEPEPASGDHEEEGEPEEAPVIAPPTSWPPDQIEDWNALSPRAKELILQRENEAQTALSSKGREVLEAKKQADTLKTDYQSRIQKLDPLIAALEEQSKSRWERIDWKKLAEEDPAEFVRLRADRDSEQEQLTMARAERQQAHSQAVAEYRQEQLQKLLDKNPQYRGETGAEKLKAEASAVEAFALRELGVNRDQLADVSAEQYEILRDAMEFRKATKQTTQPKKRPAQKSVAPTASQPKADAKKKALETAVKNVRSAARIGHNAQNAAIADLLAKRRKQ